MSKAKIKTLTSIATIIVTLFILTLNVFSYAWFSNNWSNNSITFITGETEIPESYIWIYDSDESEYVKSDIDTSDNGIAGIPGVEEDDESTYKYTVSSLQLGVVDNLVHLSDDNYCYIALIIDTEKYGSTAEIVFDLDSTNKFSIYNNSGDDVTSDYLSDLETLDYEYITIEYGILDGTTLIEPGTDDFESIEFTSVVEETPINFTNTNSILYLKLSCNLDFFAEASEILNEEMPCIFIFDYEFKVVLK